MNEKVTDKARGMFEKATGFVTPFFLFTASACGLDGMGWDGMGCDVRRAAMLMG